MDIHRWLAYSRRAARRRSHDRRDEGASPTTHTPTERKRKWVRGCSSVWSLAAVLPALATMTWVTGAAAVTTITTCGTLTKLGETYNLAKDLTSTSCETCLTVANNRITINLKDHSIIADCDGSPTLAAADVAAGISDGGVARDLITVRDGVIGGSRPAST